MKNRKISIIPVCLTLLLLLLSIGTEIVYLGSFEYRYRTRKFNRVLQQREKIMDQCLTGMKPILARGESHGSLSERGLFAIAEENRITILEYLDNKLNYWSDNDFDVPVILNDTILSDPLIFIQNGWFLVKRVQAGNEMIVGLMRLRNDYGFENDIIHNGFLKGFGVTNKTGFSQDENASGFKVYKSDGTFLFCLLFPDEKEVTYFIAVPLILWGLTFFFLIYLALQLVKYLAAGNRNALAIASCGIIFLTVYLLVLLTGKPAVFFMTELFSPYRYTMNGVIPSLGHLAIFSILLSVFSYVVYVRIPVTEMSEKQGRRQFIKLTALLVPGALLFVLHQRVFSNLILNSNINFETYKVLDLSIFSLIGYISIVLLFGVPLLYLMKVIRLTSRTRTRTLILSLLISSLVIPVFFFRKPEMLVSLMLFYFLVAAGLRIFIRAGTGMFNQTVVFALIFGLYALFLVTTLSEEKTEENIKIQLVAYSTENDPYAEHLLLDMWPLISRDSLLREMMDVVYFEKNGVDRISAYLHSRYFTGYWGNFTFNIVLCMRSDSLRIGESNSRFEDCFTFFDEKVRTAGHQLTGTGFYFMDNKLGRSNYLGRIFFDYSGGRRNGLFIDLYNDIHVFQPGYSEILLDKKYHSYARLKDYSFAKYINGQLVLSTGDFPYNKTDADYAGGVREYRSFREDSYSHVLYRSGNVTVIISRPAISAGDIIISFAYLFAFTFIFSNLILMLTRRPSLRKPSGLNFRQKLQWSLTAILLVSFSLVASVTASLAIKQYQTKHYENIKEKLNSVYVELENSISGETRLLPTWRNNNYGSLDELLVDLSNVFNTDINLYDLNGYLLATSRPEIFYRNLTSHRINNMAFINLVDLTKSEYFQEEKIGNLDYLSAYKPFYNRNNQILTYLNIPYFRLQSVLAKEISNMMVAVINFTLLLIVLGMSLAVIISSRLTAPLALLSARLASVELGKKSEHLLYKGNDEVGDLVKQYNRMVDELDESVQKLSRTEREIAWREMAKQIAHEIKNPLTPMKLNIQHLYKSWKDGVPGFEKKLEKFTRNQIEYIDNLSSIATAFSSFAKIPEPTPVRVDLIDQITTTLELFKNSGNISFRLGWPHSGKVFIYADREQVNGIFSNLIKNGIQSIPAGREGVIKVNVEEKNDRVIVSVSDNGTGIPEQLQGKMFTPNFTTKSSGAGLGLSIVKRYAESAGGRIWFESQEDRGSVFYVEFPLINSGQEP